MIARPPVWAEWVLSVIVSGRRRDSIVGDLHEEYVETRARRGHIRADIRYVREVLRFLWRGSGGWILLIAALWASRDILDATVPTTDSFHVRAAVTTYTCCAIFGSAGFHAGWRSGRLASGPIVAVVMAFI